MSMSTKTTVTRLSESCSGFDRIDREAGVIRGVKVLGTKSQNNRRYLKEACIAASDKYNDSRVYVDHSFIGSGSNKATSDTKRKTSERWGKLRNVAFKDDSEGGGLYGDLEYLKAHPLTEQILESVERFGDCGLSHDVGGKTRRENGVEVVYDIQKIYSVDFVQEPATNKNLFESVQTMEKKLFAVLREHVSNTNASQLLARLTEMDGFGEDTMMTMGDESSAEDAIDAAIKAAVIAVLDSEDDMQTKKSKIAMILGLQDKLNAGATSESTPAEGEESSKMEESVKQLKAENARLTEELSKATEERDVSHCEKLLESVGVESTPIRVTALRALKPDDRKALAESFPKKPQGDSKKPSTSPGRMQEQHSRESDIPAPGDIDGVRKLLGFRPKKQTA